MAKFRANLATQREQDKAAARKARKAAEEAGEEFQEFQEDKDDDDDDESILTPEEKEALDEERRKQEAEETDRASKAFCRQTMEVCLLD